MSKRDKKPFIEDEPKKNNNLFLALVIGVILIECLVAMYMMKWGMEDGTGSAEGLTLGLVTIGLTAGLYFYKEFCEWKEGRR